MRTASLAGSEPHLPASLLCFVYKVLSRSAIKIVLVALFAALGVASCFDRRSGRFIVAESRTFEASLFRQHCSICHGPEGEGKLLDDGKVVPSLRAGEFKFRTEAEIYKQIADGGNGMTPFRGLLTERELQLMSRFVHAELRGVK